MSDPFQDVMSGDVPHYEPERSVVNARWVRREFGITTWLWYRWFLATERFRTYGDDEEQDDPVPDVPEP